MHNANTPAVKIDSALCEAFAFAADALARRHAGEIAEDTIERFVALRWMEWRGGTLGLTQVGEIVLMKVQSRMLLAAA